MKKIKKCFTVALFTLAIITLIGCSNSHPDIRNSNGSYSINVVGKENERKETIHVTESDKNFSAVVKGRIYYRHSNNTENIFQFNSQRVTLKQKEGSVWYAKVKCTDGEVRVIFAIRSGSNQIGSVGFGGEAFGFGGNVHFPIYKHYKHINYLIYAGYDYLKN